MFYDINNVCRVCLSVDKENRSIFEAENDEINERKVEFWRILEIHGGIEVSKNDGLPQIICFKCVLKLKAAHSLWEECQETDKKLREYISKSLSFVNKKIRSCTPKNSSPDPSKNSLEPNSSPPTSQRPSKNFQNPLPSSHPCQICKKAFKKPQTLLKHLNLHKNLHPSEVYSILQQIRTPKSSKSPPKVQKTHQEDSLDITISTWIKEELSTLENPQKKSFTCASCSQSFKSKSSLIKHNRNFHSELQEFKCETCKMVFSTESKAQRHQRTHEVQKNLENSDFKRFLCHICSKTFRQMTGLTFHMRTHTGDKPYVCKFCNRGFASSSNCINHERTHTGVRPFVCHFCSFAFAKSCTLKAHITTHTGEANYECKTCGKAFKRLKYLKEHEFTHTGEKPYVCKICGAAYSHSGSLFVHEKKCKMLVKSYETGGVILEGAKWGC